MKVTLKAHTSLFEGNNDKTKVLELAGLNAGICYMPDTFDKLEEEETEKKLKRAERTLKMGHHSVVGHNHMQVIIEDIPKICAMMLNNLGEYNASEKSARYTEMKNIDPAEYALYCEWKEIFIQKITETYGNRIRNEKQIEKLAMENARYLISVFTPTTMAYTTSIRQFNYIIDWCRKMFKEEVENPFYSRVAKHMNDLADKLEEIVYVENLRDNKNRSFNLFSKNVQEFEAIEPFFGHVYQTTYQGSFAQLAQAQRHRTIDYKVYFDGEADAFYIPPIIIRDEELCEKWIRDCKSLSNNYPQATLVDILEMGTLDNFLLKTKERECGCAQLEIQNQTVSTHIRYQHSVDSIILIEKFKGYDKMVRCGFDDYTCTSPCIWGLNSNSRLI